MDSWDDDEFEVPSVAPTASNNAVAVSWEDEEEEVTPVNNKKSDGDDSPNKGQLKPKQLKKQRMKEIEEKQKLENALARARLDEQANETPEQRREREQREIEAADMDMALDSFAGPLKKKDAPTGAMETSLADMRVVTLAEHEQLGEAVANKIAESNSKYIVECMKAILTKASTNLSADDLKDLTTIINVLKNEKISAAKPKGKKKKQTGKQGYAKVERAATKTNADFDYGGGDYDDYDDFM